MNAAEKDQKKFSYFPNGVVGKVNIVPTGTKSLTEVFEMIRGDALAQVTARIRQESDETKQKKLKERLPNVVFTGIFTERKKAGLITHSGYNDNDVDHLPAEHLTEIFKALCEDSHTALAYISTRGDGIHFVTRGTADPTTHEQCFDDRAKYYEKKLALTLDTKYRKNISQASFICHHPAAFIRPDAVPFGDNGKPEDFPKDEVAGKDISVASDQGSMPPEISALNPHDLGNRWEFDCPQCHRPKCFLYKTGSIMICSHKDSCGFTQRIAAAGTGFHLSDDGNAQRYILLHGHELLYCNGKHKRWYVWDKTRFQEDRTGKAHYLARDVATHIKTEALAMPETEATQKKRKDLFAFSIASENHNKLKALVERAAVDPRIAVTPDMLDRDPWRLCVRNGYLNLRTGELETPDPERLITRQAMVIFTPSATCPKWLNLIDKATCGRRDLANFLQQVAGYLLTGETYEDKFFLFIGLGANGKSTVLETINAILGDYAVTPPPGTFLERKFNNPSAASPELAMLLGARLATMSETDKGDKVAMGLLKRLSAGGKGSSRDMYAGLESDIPTVKIIIDSNHAPRITTNDFGTWRRVVRIPFDYRFEGAELIPDFRAKMVRDEYGEHSGILNWMLEGCLKWQQAGRLVLPGEVETATSIYRKDEDPVTRFLDERTTAGDGFAAQAGLLFTTFRKWAETNGERCDDFSNVKFADEIKTRGFKKIKTNRGASYKGLAINEAESGF